MHPSHLQICQHIFDEAFIGIQNLCKLEIYVPTLTNFQKGL